MDDYRKSVGERPVNGERRREEQQHLHPLLPPPPLPLSFTEHQSLTYFTQQAIRVSAGYMAPHFENELDHIQQQPANSREAIWRQVEKERIREEIMAEEIARRRMLELEVRREIMMERELAKQSGGGFSPFSSTVTSFSPALPFLKQQTGVGSVEERLAKSLENRMGRGISLSRLGARNEIGKLEVLPFEERIPEIPFQRGVEPKISALKPVTHNAEPMISELESPNQEKDKTILLAKPNTSLSGAKRKADTPPVEISSKPPSIVEKKKNAKEDWSCALCQVSATSERGLNDHLQGKKHKSKEAALRASRDGKNYSIGLFPKKPKSINISEANDNLIMVDMVKPKVEFLPYNKSGEGSSLVILEKEGAKDNVAPALLHIADDLKKSANASPKKKTKKRYQFWCATCKVGALSEISLEAHRVGKKHKARLLQLSSIANAAPNVDNTQPVNEAVEVVEETEVIDDEGAIVDRINPEELEEVSTGDE
ncbi:hypothetical protein T459_18841 [Capsicum annuum]|uniref:U1-type domain-containing protein n=1 Tax=Capsicum annuum TaxID=4072 RepID=A0A2G2Z007_CAPAN|nr:hypothetical protein T459_18841 [Capsicum annuum]